MSERSIILRLQWAGVGRDGPGWAEVVNKVDEAMMSRWGVVSDLSGHPGRNKWRNKRKTLQRPKGLS